MRIKIESDVFGTLGRTPFILSDADIIGLHYVENSRGRVFDIVDEQLFFLMVVKYGITFKRLD